jgi:tetratricopeptide (TPR) repeat protein
MRRLNVKLALWLVGITMFSVIGVHFLHGYQIGRNAEFLRVQAEKARESGNAREAMKQYNQYLKHRDDPEGYSALAEVVLEIAKDTDATRQDRQRAYSILEEAIRRHPDLDEVRRSLIDYTIQSRRFGDALEHIQYLTEKGKKDSDLSLKIALCHYYNGDEEKSLKELSELLGYDQQTDGFVAQAPPGASEVAAFELLSQILRPKAEGAKKADAVMAKLVEWNPDSAKAHLSRAGYLINAGEFNINSQEFKDAKPELDRAIELAPDDVDVIVTVAVYAMSQGGYALAQRDDAAAQAFFARAQDLLDKALKAHPERQDIYLRLAQLSLTQRNRKKAAEQLTIGLAKATDVSMILERLIDIQFQLKDLEAAKATCKLMRDRGTISSDLIRFEEARIKFAENKYLEASRDLESVRPILARFSRTAYTLQVDLMLGKCYEYLNQPDRQLEVYRRVLEVTPNQAGARLGEAMALQSLGRHAEADQSVKLLTENVENIPFLQAPVMYLLINQQLQKPAAERDWTQIDAIAGMMYKDTARSELDNMLLKSEILMMKDEFEEAQKLLLEAQKQHSKEPRVWMTLVKLMGRNEKTRGRLAQLVTRAEKEIGETAPLRAERIRIAARQEGEQAVAQIKQLEQGLEKYTEPERISLMLTLGNAYLQARDFNSAKRCWRFAASKDPKNGNIRQFLFDLAVDTKDEGTMREVVKELQDSHNFGSQSSLYKYCAATEMLWKLNLRKQDKKGRLTADDQKVLAEARKLIDEGIAVRGEWGVLWRVRAEIDQLEGNFEGAIENYQRSLDYSRAGQVATARRLIQLLHSNGRMQEANRALKFLGETSATDPLRRVVGDIKEKSGEVDEALAMAEKDVKDQPDDAMNRVWYGQLLVRVGRADDAEVEFRKAIELNPNLPDIWELLVRHLVAMKKKNEAVEAVREASKSLAENPVALARLYERVEDHEQAEHYYKVALEEHPEDLLAMRRIVEYYLGVNQIVKAVPYLDQIIQKTAKSTEKTELAQLAWARRSKGQVLASKGDYEHVMEAVKLIDQNRQSDGRLPPDDAVAIVQLLSNRREPESREKAIQLLLELQKVRALLPREQALLAQLYTASGRWMQARDLMLAAISRRSDDPEILINLANMLINHDEYDDASRWVDRVEELIKPPAQASDTVKQAARRLRARLLVHDGKKEQAVQVLESLVPSPLPQNQLFRLEVVSKMMESLGLNEGAERLLNDYMSQEPRGTIAMASYVGRRGDIDRAFALLEDARKNQPMIEILPCALEALRGHRDKATKERFKMLEEWVEAGLKGEANPQQIKLLLAELYDLQGRYPEVISTYRDLLTDEEANAYQKALVKNNLAFVLAITKESPQALAEALKITDEAIRVLGPTSDLLDTRGLVYMNMAKSKEALADLRTAIAADASSTKYFHLAMAEKQAGNVEAARTALAKAVEMGIDANQFTPLEKANFEKLTTELK